MVFGYRRQSRHTISQDHHQTAVMTIYQHARKEGQRVALTETARLRLAEVERWLADQNGEIVILADDAVDYCLNGKFAGGFDSIAVGDFVGVRYYLDHQPGDLLVPHTIRISKPIP